MDNSNFSKKLDNDVTYSGLAHKGSELLTRVCAKEQNLDLETARKVLHGHYPDQSRKVKVSFLGIIRSNTRLIFLNGSAFCFVFTEKRECSIPKMSLGIKNYWNL